MTLISIAGGGLDTVVPSDYASLASLVPETHGFTVFTSSIPRVWTGMDHLEITFCDQLRKVLIRALYDVVDVNRPAQTRPRAERMRSFKKWLLTGMEDFAERTLPHRGTGLFPVCCISAIADNLEQIPKLSSRWRITRTTSYLMASD